MKTLLPALLWLLSFVSLPGQIAAPKPSAEPPSFFQSLQRDSILHLYLHTELKALLRKRETYQPALLHFRDSSGQIQELEVEVRPRGKMRRDICFLPPLKLRLAKSDLRARGLNPDFKTIKLVVSCRTAPSYQRLVLLEYLVYRMYNLVTDFSFRVQLVRIHLQDRGGDEKSFEVYGFLIEPAKELAHRLGGKELKPRVMSPRGLDTLSFDRLCLFQFMIGNTDWAVYNRHNLVVVRSPLRPLAIPVPYDFDYAGIIDAPYAAPHEKLPIKHVSQRYFLGLCRPESHWKPLFEEFRARQDDFREVIRRFPYLDDSAKKGPLRYLDDFFKLLGNDRRCRREIVEHCDTFIK